MHKLRLSPSYTERYDNLEQTQFSYTQHQLQFMDYKIIFSDVLGKLGNNMYQFTHWWTD